MLRGFDHDDFGFGVSGLVEASFGCICDINTCVDIIVHDAADVGDGPFRCVEAHDTTGRTLSHSKMVASLRKSHCIFVV